MGQIRGAGMEQVKLSGEIKVADLLQRIEATLVSKLNLADFQNAVPMLREVSIVNDAEFEILNLELQLTSVPAFFRPKIWRIDSIGAGKRYALSDLDVQLDGALFSHLTEAEKAKAISATASASATGTTAIPAKK